MFKIVELVGSSPEGYTEAVKDVINKVSAGGEKPAWFEVVEQRGAIIDGKLKEFQVKLKVAVAIPKG